MNKNALINALRARTKYKITSLRINMRDHIFQNLKDQFTENQLKMPMLALWDTLNNKIRGNLNKNSNLETINDNAINEEYLKSTNLFEDGSHPITDELNIKVANKRVKRRQSVANIIKSEMSFPEKRKYAKKISYRVNSNQKSLNNKQVAQLLPKEETIVNPMPRTTKKQKKLLNEHAKSELIENPFILQNPIQSNLSKTDDGILDVPFNSENIDLVDQTENNMNMVEDNENNIKLDKILKKKKTTKETSQSNNIENAIKITLKRPDDFSLSHESKEINNPSVNLNSSASQMNVQRRITRKNSLIGLEDSDLDFIPKKLPGLRKYTKDSDSSVVFSKSKNSKWKTNIDSSIRNKSSSKIKQVKRG